MSRFSLVALAAALALLLAACADPGRAPTAPADPTAASADRSVPARERVTAAVRWNARTWAAVGRRVPNPFYAVRAFALVSVAMYNAVIAAEDAKARRVHPSEAGAVAGAAAAVLAGLYPAERDSVETELAEDAAYFPGLPSERDADWAAGVAVGRDVAATVLAYAAHDGSGAVWSGTFETGSGLWTPEPAPAVPLLPLWGNATPWLLASGDQFRPEAPPAFEASAEYFRDLDEVRRYASLDPTDPVRVEQLRIARHWQFGPPGPGTSADVYVPIPGWSLAGYFGSVAADLIARHHLDERKAARVFAVMYMAVMDASIACMEAKYHYLYIRPWQADPTIVPLARPSFPSYPSAHSCNTASALGALGGMFPSAADDLRPLIEEAGEARIYAGMHFRFDVVAGQELGYAVAANTLRLAPDGHEPIRLPIPLD